MTAEEIIKSMLDIISPVMKRNKTKSLNFPDEFTFFHSIERINFNLQTLDLLINIDLIKYDHAIGLCCRNLLSDFITTGFIVKLSKDEEDYYVNFYRLYYSDLNREHSFLNLFIRAGIATENDRKKINDKKNDPREIHKLVFDYAAEFELKNFPSSTDIVSQFIKSKNDDLWSQEIINSYDVWSFYSKYEHIGWHSYGLTRDTSKDKATKRLIGVLKKTTILLASCLEILKEKPAFEKSVELMMQVYKS